ncbi:hypothetical protein [Terricaulis silvestris]|uniref:Sulfotransferase domain protein n=1 Tax=Terricaulis silvestris TaxID=2686094 RepID=A0A6I6MMM4_9CAUL|nr:hypothetical protein [Terricaulis silvestris]QGZ96540.1 hypothetical protein DSM104635_03400 [Terricaulis silvestris]
MRLYIHIGIGKTGTSSIQHMLANSAQALADCGFYYPQQGRNGTAAHHSLAAFDVDDLGVGIEAYFKALLEELDAQSAPNAILSSEGFCFCRPRVVRRIGELLSSYHVRVIFYARRPVELIASSYLEKLKAGQLTNATIEQFYKVCLAERSFFMSDRLDSWAIEFGRQALSVRLYDRRFLKGDSVSDFLDVIGAGEMPADMGEVQENPTLSSAFVPCLEAFDRAAPSSPMRPHIVAALVNASEDVVGSDIFSAATLKQIARDHAVANAIFAQTYLSREEARAFIAP